MNNRGRPFKKRRGDFHGFGSPNRGRPFGNDFMYGPFPGPAGPRYDSWDNWSGGRGGRGHFNRPGPYGRGFQNQNRRPNRDSNNPGKRLSEKELGITEYVSTLAGFKGVIKSRYSDFQVNEVSVNGHIAKLTDKSFPKLETPSHIVDEDLGVLDKYNVEVLPIETWDKLNALVLQPKDCQDKIEVDATEMSKDHRTKVYDSIDKVFGNKMFGATVNNGDKKMIIFSKSRPGGRTDKREKWKWPAEYVHFVVHKENMDTMEAANLIASGLRMSYIKPSFFGYSGTKDRRAKTSQWFSLRRVDPKKIYNGCKNLRNIHVGNFEFKDYHLKLGYLKGNRFRIALRNVTVDDPVINHSLESLRDNGFVNYYGLQRFGTRADIPTYKVGRYLLQGKFQDAIDLILEPHGPFSRLLQMYKDTKDAKAVIQRVPSYKHTVELKLLAGLAYCPKKDLVGALERIPRNTRLLYLHSYQSWVWNRCISERIKRFGLKLCVGDFVPKTPGQIVLDTQDLVDDAEWDRQEEMDEEKNEEGDREETEKVKVEDGSKQDKDAVEEIKENEEKGTSEEVKGAAETSGNDQETSNTEETKGPKKERELSKKFIKYPKMDKPDFDLKAIDEEDIKKGSYTIFDVFLPLPGYNVQYPSNMKDFYEKLTQEDDLNLEMKQRVKAYNLSGTYRKMLIKPDNISWSTLSYTDPHSDLILSDIDELNKKNPIESLTDGKYKALLIDFTLPSSTYATMALREILKQDTSNESQAQQNDYHKTKTEDKSAEGDSVEVKDQSVEREGEEVVADEGGDSLRVDKEIPEVEKRKSDDIGNGDCKKTKFA